MSPIDFGTYRVSKSEYRGGIFDIACRQFDAQVADPVERTNMEKNIDRKRVIEIEERYAHPEMSENWKLEFPVETLGVYNTKLDLETRRAYAEKMS